MAAILEFKNITKIFGGITALDQVSFSVEEGEVHCICGENGAGKSTLINLCGGVFLPTEGTIYVHGKETLMNSIQKSERLGIAVVHQEVPLCLNMSVAHNIFMGSHKANKGIFLDEKYMSRKTSELLELFHLNIKPSDLLESLSIAEQSIVQIAKAVFSKPKVLILDEPTAALTNDQRDVMFKVVRQLIKENNTTVIYVSHRLDEVMELGQRVTIFKDGRFVATKNINEISVDDIISMMVGRLIDKLPEGRKRPIGDKLLSVRGISRHRKFHDVSFDLHKGEILGLAGFVGSGRTEILESLFGADKLDAGEVIISGNKVNIHSPIDAINNRISLIPENRRDDGLITTMSIQQNALITVMKNISKNGLLNKKLTDKLMAELIDKFKIKIGKAEDGILTLSGGNQQKVVIAKWIANNPLILFCDEPTRGIDVGAKAEVYGILRNIAEQGIGILMVSSELPELLTLCDRILVMHEGKMTGEVMAEDASEELIMKYASAV